ncbi:hypothetical protein ACWIGI_28870 [Nocardia sp. NPDC055321]
MTELPRGTRWTAKAPGRSITSTGLPRGTRLVVPSRMLYTPPPLAAFTSVGTLAAAGAPAVAAAFAGSGTLSATAVPVATAAFSGAGALLAISEWRAAAGFTGAGALAATGSPQATGVYSGAGTLTATAYPVATAAFTGAGTVAATGYPQATAAFSGAGTLAATAATFTRSGMNRNGNYTVPTSNAVVPSWTADPGRAGSTVSGNGVVANGTKPGAELLARLNVTNLNFGSYTITLRLMLDGVQKATAPTSIASTATQDVTLSVNADVTSGQILTVEAVASAGANLRVNGGTVSYVRIN